MKGLLRLLPSYFLLKEKRKMKTNKAVNVVLARQKPFQPLFAELLFFFLLKFHGSKLRLPSTLTQ